MPIDPEQAASQGPNLRTMSAKDVTVINYVPAWDPKSGRAVENFLDTIEEAAALGGLSDKDKVRVIKLKAQGTAQLFLDTHPEMKTEITYARLKVLLKERFKPKHSDFYFQSQLQNAKQDRLETPEDFADRVRKLSRKTVRQVEHAGEQRIINEEAERRLLIVFINGLIGTAGNQVRFQMPDNMDKAVKVAMLAYRAEKDQERETKRDKNPAKVFVTKDVAMRTNSQGNQRNKYPGRDGNQWGQNNTRFSNQRGNPGHTPVNKGYGGAVKREVQPGYQEKRVQQGVGSTPGGNDGYRAAGRGRTQCFRCRELGHIARNCRKVVPGPASAESEGGSRNLNGMGRRQ